MHNCPLVTFINQKTNCRTPSAQRSKGSQGGEKVVYTAGLARLRQPIAGWGRSAWRDSSLLSPSRRQAALGLLLHLFLAMWPQNWCNHLASTFFGKRKESLESYLVSIYIIGQDKVPSVHGNHKSEAKWTNRKIVHGSFSEVCFRHPVTSSQGDFSKNTWGNKLEISCQPYSTGQMFLLVEFSHFYLYLLISN